MKKLLGAVAVVLFVVSVAFSASLDEAKKNVKDFIAYAKAHGKDKALAEVNPDGLFGVKKLGEAYIFVFDKTKPCVMLAHGANPKLVGKNLCHLKDIKGNAFVKKFYEVAEKGSGVVEYYWTNPKTKKIQPKASYVEAYDGMIVIAGVYK